MTTQEPTSVAEAMMQLNDNLLAFVEAAAGVKAMATEQGFRPTDASRMGADAFNFALSVAVKGLA